MQTNETIEAAIETLEQAKFESGDTPAIVRLAPDKDAYVLGNREGYVKLAIASLKAAQGTINRLKTRRGLAPKSLILASPDFDTIPLRTRFCVLPEHAWDELQINYSF